MALIFWEVVPGERRLHLSMNKAHPRTSTPSFKLIQSLRESAHPDSTVFPKKAPARLEKDRCDPRNAGEGICDVLGEENLCAGPVMGTTINAEIQRKPKILQEQRKE